MPQLTTNFENPFVRRHQERLLAIDERIKDFQSACNEKLSEFTAFLNGNFELFVQQLLVEIDNFSKTMVDESHRNVCNEQEGDNSATDDYDCSAEADNISVHHMMKHIDFENDECSTNENDISILPAASSGLTKSAPKTFQCDICPKMYTTKPSLLAHRRSHTGDKTIHCDICKRSFNLKQSLAIHMRTHTDERPYMCHMCSKTFKQSTPFRRHMRSHTLDKPHQCTMCDRAFIEKSYLKVHMQSHTGERPHICPVCSRGYTKRYHVRQHLKNFHKVTNVNEVFPQNQRRSINETREDTIKEEDV